MTELKDRFVSIELKSGFKIEGVILQNLNGNLIIDPVISGISIPLDRTQIKQIQLKLK